jgi:hypothetical protein
MGLVVDSKKKGRPMAVNKNRMMDQTGDASSPGRQDVPGVIGVGHIRLRSANAANEASNRLI